MGSPIVWFDIPAQDLDRAIRFYSAVLGMAIRKETFPGAALAIFPHPDGAMTGCLYQAEAEPAGEAGPLLYFDCSGRLDQALAAVEPSGGAVLQPRRAIGPYGFRAIVRDSEGNRIALHSPS